MGEIEIIRTMEVDVFCSELWIYIMEDDDKSCIPALGGRSKLASEDLQKEFYTSPLQRKFGIKPNLPEKE